MLTDSGKEADNTQGVKNMGINIQPKNDFSFMFSSLGSGAANVGGSNFLSDYASIKNGSYAKLMKAYYAKDGANDTVKNITRNNSTSKDSSKELSKVQSATDNLKDSADALMATGSKSLFQLKDITTKDENGVETTVKGYDTEAIYKAVNQFVNDYNSVIQSADDMKSTSIQTRLQSMVTATSVNGKMLGKMGISINKDNTLSINKEQFQKADMNTVKSLFNGSGSYSYRVSAQASMINFAADNEASKANTYNFNGNYSNNYNSGNIFNSYL